MSKPATSLLPPDDILHKRESQWLSLLQRLEAVGDEYADAQEIEIADSFLEIEKESEDEQVDDDSPVAAEDAETEEDYKIFTKVLAEGQKEIQERKKHWRDTGDSFVFDNFSENTRVQDWVKENIENETDCNLDISTVYSDLCKKKKLQSTFLDQSRATARSLSRETSPAYEPPTKQQLTIVSRTPKMNSFRTVPKPSSASTAERRKSTTLSPIKCESTGDPHTPTKGRTPLKPRPQSESTLNRRVAGGGRNPRLLMKQMPRRLSTVPESPSVQPAKKTIRRAASVNDIRMPRERTIIYSPMQPLVDNRFQFVLKSKNFDPTKMWVFEPFSDLEDTDSDEDILMTMKKKNGGRIFQI